MTRILAVDDQPANLRLVHEILTPAGFEVREARSGAEALALAQESAPDLILLDMHLPDMHGLEVLRRLRESAWGKGLRVVAMSALASAVDRALWVEAGCLGTIEKPITVKTFRQEISRWLTGAPPAAPEKPEAPERNRHKLGEILLANSLISPEQLWKALAAQAESGGRLGQLLVEQGVVSEDDIAWALSNQLGYPYIFLTREIIDEEAVGLLPEEFLRERRILPILKFGGEMRLAMADPTDQDTVDEVASRSGLQVKRALALASNIEDILNRLSSRHRSGAAAPGAAEVATEAQYFRFHLVQALHQGASEVHFDPAIDGQGRVRYRLQGLLVDRADQQAELHAAILRHLHDLTGCGEDPIGAASATVTVGDVETRLMVTFLPTAVGPAATVTLYPSRTGAPDLTPLAVDGRSIRALRGVLEATRGVVMVGCAEMLMRSTLLHGLIPSAQRGKTWALETVPVYRRPTLNQTVVRSPDQVAAHLAAAAAAGADLIVVDDVSRSEALIAAHEAGRTRMVLAGHPQDDVVGLLSQALDAAGAALVASTLQGILAARTVRVLCPECKEPLPPGSGPADKRPTFFGRGCEACGFTGFRGQRVLTEIWIIEAEARLLLHSGASQALFERVMQQVGSPMREQGLALVEDGLLSLDELSRVVKGVPWTSPTSSS